MKKFFVLFVAFSLMLGLCSLPSVYAVDSSSDTIYNILNPDGTWGTYDGKTFARQGIQNLQSQSTSAEEFQSYYGNEITAGPGNEITHGIRFKSGGPYTDGVRLKSPIQFALGAGQTLDTTRNWKNTVAIEGYFGLICNSTQLADTSDWKIGVSIFGGDWITKTLMVPFDNFVNIDTANIGKWQHFSIPLSYLEANGVGIHWANTYGDNGNPSSWNDTDWTKINGFAVIASTTQTAQLAYFADLKFVSCAIDPPCNPQIISNSAGNVKISWDAPEGTEPAGYKVSRGIVVNGTVSNVTVLNSEVTATEYTDLTADDGTKYKYYIQSYNDISTSEAIEIDVTVGDITVELPEANNGVMYNILNPGGIWGTYDGKTFARQGIQNLQSQSTSAEEFQSYYGNEITAGPGNGVTHGIRFKSGGPYTDGARLKSPIQFAISAGQTLDTARDWKNNVAIEGYFGIICNSTYLTDTSDWQIGISIFGGDWITKTLMVPFDNFVNIDTANIGKWQHFSIPLSYLEANGVGIHWANTYGDNGNPSSWNDTDWTKINGFAVIASTTQTAQLAYFADLKFTSHIDSPLNPEAQLNDNSVDLSWTPVSGASGYKIYRGTVNGDVVTGITELSLNNTAASYTDTLPTVSGRTYRYYIQAFNDTNASELAKKDITIPSAEVILNTVVYKNEAGTVITGSAPSSGTIKSELNIELTSVQSAILVTAVYNGTQLINAVISDRAEGVGIHSLTTSALEISGSGYSVKSFVWNAESYKPYLSNLFILD